MRTCSCGRPIYAVLGKRCPVCQAKHRARKPRIPKPIKHDPKRNPRHLAWIRTLPCAVPGCLLKAQAAHVRAPGTGGGMGMKPPDLWCVGLCAAHHREQHLIGHRAFDAKYGINLRAIAEELARLSPYLTSTDRPDRPHRGSQIVQTEPRGCRRGRS